MNMCRFEITPLTPLHIGIGETLYPYEYAFANRRLYRFDLTRLVDDLNEDKRRQISEIIALDDADGMMLRLRDFVSAQFDWIKDHNEYVIPASTRAETFLRERWGNAQSTHELTVAPSIRANGLPFIPGSSLKGALRTALLFKRAPNLIRVNRGENVEDHFLRGGFDQVRDNQVRDDWLRFLKVGDAENLAAHAEPITQLRVIERFTRGDNGAAGTSSMPQLIEVIRENGFCFSHRVVVDEEGQKRVFGAVRFTLQEILDACREFGVRHWQGESVFFREVNDTDAASATRFYCTDRVVTDGFLLRLGGGSGRDAMTIRYKRADAQPDGETLPSREELESTGEEISEWKRATYTPRTRALVEGAPLGWVLVRVVVEERTGILNLPELKLTPAGPPQESAKPPATAALPQNAESQKPNIPPVSNGEEKTVSEGDVDAKVAEWKRQLEPPKSVSSPEQKKKDAGAMAKQEYEEAMRRWRKGQ